MKLLLLAIGKPLLVGAGALLPMRYAADVELLQVEAAEALERVEIEEAKPQLLVPEEPAEAEEKDAPEKQDD